MTHPAAAVLTGLIGRPVHRLVRYEDGPVGLLLLPPSASSESGPGAGAGATTATQEPPITYLHLLAGAWRLLDGDRVIDGSYHEAEPEELGYAEALRGRTVDGIRVESNGDAVVSLSGLRLVVWCAAAREPSFGWYRPGTESVVVSPDGIWTHAVLDLDHPLREVGDVAIGLADHEG